MIFFTLQSLEQIENKATCLTSDRRRVPDLQQEPIRLLPPTNDYTTSAVSWEKDNKEILLLNMTGSRTVVDYAMQAINNQL